MKNKLSQAQKCPKQRECGTVRRQAAQRYFSFKSSVKFELLVSKVFCKSIDDIQSSFNTQKCNFSNRRHRNGKKGGRKGRGPGMVQWERSPSTKEAWVRMLDTVSYLKCVKLVVGSHLTLKVFL